MQELVQPEGTESLRSPLSIRSDEVEKGEEGRKVQERERDFAYLTTSPFLWGNEL